VYPNETVAGFVESHFVPVRVHARQQADEFKRLGGRFSAQWTPTILVVDPAAGEERHRIEGFLPVDEFLSQLRLGLAHAAFARQDFDASEELFREIQERHPDTDAAAEAQYWEGVSRYKKTGDAAALNDTARRFRERYQGTTWARKASVWQ
jgi:hypothetical protein